MSQGAVLIVDPDAARARRIADACSLLGYATRVVGDGSSALEAVLAQTPDAVIAAPQLPLIDADQLADIVRANPRTQNVVFLFLEAEGTEAAEDADQIAAALSLRLAAVSSAEAENDAPDSGPSQGDLDESGLTPHLARQVEAAGTGKFEVEEGERRGSIELVAGSIAAARTGAASDEKALFRILSWNQGQWSWRPGSVEGAASIITPARLLLAEAARQKVETERLRGRLPAADSRLVASATAGPPDGGESPLTREVQRLLEVCEYVEDIVDHSRYPDHQVLRALDSLIERGAVEVRRAQAPLPQGEGEELFSAGQRRRLERWLEAGRGAGTGALRAKVLVLAGDVEATRELATLFAETGVTHLPESLESWDPEQLRTLFVIDAGGELRIDVVSIPLAERSSALWPLVMHGALAVMVVHGAAIEESIARVRPILETLAHGAEPRVLPVVLLRKNESPGFDDLEEEGGGFDRAAPCLVPIEDPTRPRERLRALVTRMVP